ncbi:MAG: glycine zipper family protein [Myxococcota bacterium]
MLAAGQSRFDPTLADEPPSRTVSETHPQGGDVVGSGAIAKGAVKGAVGGVVVGAIAGDAGKGAAIGAGAGALFGGVRRHRATQKRVTTARTNPEYTAYVEAKNGYRTAFDACMAARAAQPVAP